MGKLESLRKFISKRFEGAFLSNVVFVASKIDFISKGVMRKRFILRFCLREVCHDAIAVPLDWNLNNRKKFFQLLFQDTFSYNKTIKSREFSISGAAAVNEKT